MGLPNVMNTGRSGMMAAKAAIATTGHNISGSNTEGYSRQRVDFKADKAEPYGGKGLIGKGVLVARVDRVNDEYLEKQIQNSNRNLSNAEEKELLLHQTEDIFNEMNGDGLNRLVSRFFNEFRKLANDPNSEAIRQSVRESSQAMINDFKRIRTEVDEVRNHIDARLEGYVREVNTMAEQVKDLNMKIRQEELSGASANDLLDRRDVLVKQLASHVDISTHKDEQGNLAVSVRGLGPLVTGPNAEKFSVSRSPADDQGKPENAYDIKSSGSVQSSVTHQIKGGKIGGLLEVRDKTLSTILDRLDEMAFGVSKAVNEIHEQGITRGGQQGVKFFKDLPEKFRAAEYLEISDAVKTNVNNIATAAAFDSPGDNRIAIAISGLQSMRLMNDGKATVDDWYNSIVSDVGVMSAQNRENLNQQKNIVSQLGNLRDRISGVSLDEETANLLQYQHTFDASAKVIQIADDMLKTVLELRR